MLKKLKWTEDWQPGCNPKSCAVLKAELLWDAGTGGPIRYDMISPVAKVQQSEQWLSGGIVMRIDTSLLLACFLSMGLVPGWAQAQTSSESNSAPSPSAVDSYSPSWLFPIEELDESLPTWLHIGGEYRDRFEGPTGIGFAAKNDTYVLDRLRVIVAIQPEEWLKVFGEVQDARIFFNNNIPSANPYRDTWTGPFGKATLSLVVRHQVGSMRLEVARSLGSATSV
jgi:hypothetical protein